MEPALDFGPSGGGYRHFRLAFDASIATVTLAVDPEGGLRDDYSLKLNSYDLAVDIELHDIVQRLRFEHPEVHAVVLTSGLENVFCAGANIQMLRGASHHHKVNFCKFTNETRLAIEDASLHSGQVWLCAANATTAGGGYELALACDEIILVDDRTSAVSLPEVAVLGVLPGTGGLTRLVDKRYVRRDLADLFATRAEGVRGAPAVAWGLVDSVAPRTRFAEHVHERALARAAGSDRPVTGPGVVLEPLARQVDGDVARYGHVEVRTDPGLATAFVVVSGPRGDQPTAADELVGSGSSWWPLAVARELDDALLHLRFEQPEVASIAIATTGDPAAMLAVDDVLAEHADHWFGREVRLAWKRVLKRLDLTAKTIVALVEPGSCFAGTLAELALAADRSFLLDGVRDGATGPPAALTLGEANTGWYPMGNGLTRLEARCWGHPKALAAAIDHVGKELDAASALDLGLVTATPDDLDWDDEVRLALEERAAFSPDALTAMEANLRFVGPETMETKIFGRLSAWQNWVFQRPNATGPDGALHRYGTGSRPVYDPKRV